MDLGRYKEAEKYLQDSIALNETKYIDTTRINQAICLLMQGYAFNSVNKELVNRIKGDYLNLAKRTLQRVVFSKNTQFREKENLSFDKLIQVADAKVLYSLVLFILKEEQDNFSARAIFEQALKIDPRYRYIGWVKKYRGYPNKI